jgi:hypothetical protein
MTPKITNPRINPDGAARAAEHQPVQSRTARLVSGLTPPGSPQSPLITPPAPNPRSRVLLYTISPSRPGVVGDGVGNALDG